MPDFDKIFSEITYSAVRSSGAGGQHVNKTASKVMLQFDVENSEGLTSEEKERIFRKLESRLTKNKELILDCEETRSQHKNKELVNTKFQDIITAALKKRKPRKKTRRTKASNIKRLKKKKIQADKKSNRQKPSL